MNQQFTLLKMVEKPIGNVGVLNILFAPLFYLYVVLHYQECLIPIPNRTMGAVAIILHAEYGCAHRFTLILADQVRMYRLAD